MFAKSLPNTKKRELLEIVRLLQTFEAPLLWDGKKEEDITGNTNLSDISFNISDSLKELWGNAVSIYGDDEYLHKKDSTEVIDKLLDEIRGIRITHQNDKDERIKIAASILSDITNSQEKSSACTKTHLRIILFEAMRLSGFLTDSKRNLLQLASVAYGIDGESFNELLAQALALHKEIKRSVNLVLE